MHTSGIAQRGFTLIELSIVLVIIGLIVGGVLVGQDLIHAAEVRAQISQIEKYNTAVNTFRVKYNALPGDMNVATATQFGFNVPASCTGAQAARDGNGLIDGFTAPFLLVQGEGETTLFWQDLSSAHLIEGSFPNGNAAPITCLVPGGAPILSGTTVSQYFPPAKIGGGNFVYVYETNGYNWYGVSAVAGTDGGGNVFSNTTISVLQAYSIDSKMDDGFPTTGKVQAAYLNGSNQNPTTAPNAASDSATSCYNTTSNAYSRSISGGSGRNCALSFQFQ